MGGEEDSFVVFGVDNDGGGFAQDASDFFDDVPEAGTEAGDNGGGGHVGHCALQPCSAQLGVWRISVSKSSMATWREACSALANAAFEAAGLVLGALEGKGGG